MPREKEANDESKKSRRKTRRAHPRPHRHRRACDALEGKEIVTGSRSNGNLRRFPIRRRLKPQFRFTKKGERARRKTAADEAVRLKKRFNYYGYSYGSLMPRNDARFDRIRTADDLKGNEANRIEGAC